MAKLDRLLALVHALSETTEGLTLDEMAERLGVNRRTAERMRDIIANHFDLDEIADDRRKRFLIRGSLRRTYGLVHGPLTYLLGKMPGRDDKPVYFRLDRMMGAEVSEALGCAPDDWDTPRRSPRTARPNAGWRWTPHFAPIVVAIPRR